MGSKVFVSGQIEEKDRIREVFATLGRLGYEVTHDWTRTDDIGDKLKNREEAGHRAAKDISGVVASDLYVLMSDNERCGKGMYAELGAALALNETTGKPEICMVGPMNHMSIFYLHPRIRQYESLTQLVDELSTQQSQTDFKELTHA